MMLVTAVIKPFKLAAVKDALETVGATSLTVSEAQGFGRQKGHNEVYRGAEYQIAFMPKLRVEVLADDGAVAGIIDAISKAACTETIGDGKIWVMPVDAVMRIRTGETGPNAI